MPTETTTTPVAEVSVQPTSSEISQVTPVETAKVSSEPVVETSAIASAIETPKEEVAPTDPVQEYEEYDLELAENSSLSEDDLNEIAQEASRLSLSKEDAEKLLLLKENSYKKGLSKHEAEYAAKIQSARAEIEADPDFIGDKKLDTFASINRAVQAFGDPELIKLLNTPEVGNSLVIAKFLKRLGDTMAPDTMGGKGEISANNNAGSDSLKSLYPDFYK